ncbi:M28 family peptidase [Gulosibacter sp. 10]|uniref:M28 family peptidase n=1 Tax=Gulosibacter sp. 10 TaxID=1255570 RepID=UPI00097F15A6|nr:M28 family peptidase [Gulosibacter sp. 10]SJM49305.1 Aminopeptidase Y (Arg, Lys, Leu preference) [Gulosibacter sp. 10]
MDQHIPPAPRAFARTRSRLRGGAVALAAATLAVPFALGSGLPAAAAPEDGLEAIEAGDLLPGYQDEFLALPDGESVFAHVEHLAVDIGPRVAGTEAEDEAIAYVEGLLEEYGFDTYIETFEARPGSFADVVPSRDDVEGHGSWQFAPATNSLFTGPDAPVTAPVVDVADGSALEDRPLEGAFVLVDWVADADARAALIGAIAEHDPAGIILTATAANAPIPRIGAAPAGTEDLIVAAAGDYQGDRIRALLETGPLDLAITTDTGGATSSNVIGVRPAVGDEDGTAPIVYIGAHIDSVVGSPGASDNASGVGVMLQIAELIGRYPLDVEIRVGAWGAEEQGIVGSAHHAAQLTQDEIDRTIGAWNFDMAGTSYPGTADRPTDFYGLSVNPDNEDNAVLDLTGQITEYTGHGPLNRGYVGRSDHQSFHDVGIDAAVFSWMYWSPETSIVLEPTYHNPSDTIDFISSDRLGTAAQFVGGSVFLAALNEVEVSVLDESGAAAAEVPVAMSCEGDEGWRDAGTTGPDGALTTGAPHVECDFAALADDGAAASAEAVQIAGDTSVTLELAQAAPAPTGTEEPVPTGTEEPGDSPDPTGTEDAPGTTAPSETASEAGDGDPLARTGDDRMLTLLALALLFAGAGTALAVYRRRRPAGETVE